MFGCLDTCPKIRLNTFPDVYKPVWKLVGISVCMPEEIVWTSVDLTGGQSRCLYVWRVI